jgi:hypothetical protein
MDAPRSASMPTNPVPSAPCADEDSAASFGRLATESVVRAALGLCLSRVPTRPPAEVTFPAAR